MQTENCQNLLKKCINLGFSISSISIATQIPKEDIKQILENSNYRLNDINKEKYLLVFLMQLYFEKPEKEGYYRSMLEVLIEYFEIELETIAKYINIDSKELMEFEKSSNKTLIEKNIARLFTTFIRNPYFSI